MKSALIFVAFTSLAVAVQGAAYYRRDGLGDFRPSSLLDGQAPPKETPAGSMPPPPPGPPPSGSIPPGPAKSPLPVDPGHYRRQASPISDMHPTTSCKDGQAPPNQTPGGSVPPGPFPSGSMPPRLSPSGLPGFPPNANGPSDQGHGHGSVRPNSNPTESPLPNSTPGASVPPAATPNGNSAQPSPSQAN
jgi:hypothetical protein